MRQINRSSAILAVDAHYTPTHIAKELLCHLQRLPSGLIADFAVGGGELLIQAARRWPRREIVACDISRCVVSSISERWESWRVGRCDFLSPRSRASSRVLRDARGRVALCIANPPFSYRGSRSWRVDTGDGSTVLCSPAVAFLLTAVEYLRPGGHLLAIVPANSVRSQRDEEAINLLSQIGEFSVLDRYPRGTFPSCTAETVSIDFRSARGITQGTIRSDQESPWRLEVQLIRGCAPMHRVGPLRKGLIPVVHTSNLNGHRVYQPACGVAVSNRSIKGPAVLLPRVGKPTSGKISLYTADEPVVLSDCVFALICPSAAHALYLLNLLVDNWVILRRGYHGTCAPYMTTADLIGVLSSLSIRARVGSLQERGEEARLPVQSGAMEEVHFSSCGGSTVLDRCQPNPKIMNGKEIAAIMSR